MKKLISILLLLLISPIVAASVGTVLFTMKKVIAQNGGVTRTLSRGSPLEVEDTIITATDAAAKIKYTNGTVVTLGPNTNYKIVAYAPSQAEVLKADLKQGKMESQTNGGIKREALKTPVVALAITGTKYKVFVRNRKITNVELIQGSIKIGNKLLQPGESIVATMHGISPAPFPAAGNIIVPSEMSSLTTESSSSSSSSSTSTTSQASGADTTAFVTTTTIVSQTTAANSGVGEAQGAFSIQCFPTGTPTPAG